MATNIFRVMCSIQKAMMSDNKAFPNERISFMKTLSAFVKSGVFTDSESEKFICANYRLSNKALADEWNIIHVSSKSEHTFRGQVSTLSSKLLSLFGCSIEEFELAFMSEESSPLLSSINDIITAFEFDSVAPDYRYDFTLKRYLHDYDCEGDYSLEECQQELALLRLFDAENLKAMCESVDKDKLAYLYRMMSANLVLFEDYVVPRKNKSTGVTLIDDQGNAKTRKYILPVINDIKVSLYKVLKQTQPTKLSLVRPAKPKTPKLEAVSSAEIVSAIEEDVAVEEGIAIEEDVAVEEDVVEDITLSDEYKQSRGTDSVEPIEFSSVSYRESNCYKLNVQENVIAYIERLGNSYSTQEMIDGGDDEEDAIEEWLRSLNPSTLISDIDSFMSGRNRFSLSIVLERLKGK